ncbi:response regulator [Mangrovibrevibacter kandeliae]|uniref:hypothetical protein n=1 Tax=Mangrovibrevibacter kandeliae TaxID=2968473 RepID=UPI0021196884|nr:MULTISPECIES: hypothetical protein [unclassified Aurantimonas]MCQ8781630.1 hypothetical protein [Aurantimonas sp. CSK15Z-1]MCW4114924.1 hypothetical protein [Aurantimonas sp. MSK8Z-1]
MAVRLRPAIVTAEVALADGSFGIDAADTIVPMTDALPIFVTAFSECQPSRRLVLSEHRDDLFFREPLPLHRSG